MSIAVTFSTGSLYTFGLDRVFGWVSEAGYDGVEVMMDDRWDTHQAAYLSEMVERHGVPIEVLHPPIYEGAWRLSRDETLVRSARLAAELGIPTLVAHPPKPGDMGAWCEGPLARARETGVTVAVENMPRSEPKNWRERVVGFAGSSCLSHHLDGIEDITLDTSHVAASGLDLMSFYGDVASRLRHVHLSDSDLGGGDQHRMPGRGRLPLKPLLGAISESGYEGTVGLELKPFQTGAPHPEKILRRMEEALAYVRSGLGSPTEAK